MPVPHPPHENFPWRSGNQFRLLNDGAEFFAKPITLTFGIEGRARIVNYASYAYGVRIYGDRSAIGKSRLRRFFGQWFWFRPQKA